MFFRRQPRENGKQANDRMNTGTASLLRRPVPATQRASRFWGAVILNGTIAILVGFLTLFCTMYYFDRSPKTGEWTKPAGDLLQSLGVSAIVFGVFNIMIGLPDWSRYFERRLQNIVLEYGYLNSLGDDQLRNLYRLVIRAIFKSTSVDRAGSFAEYFDRHLHRHLGEPFRENARCVLTYEDDDDDYFFVHDFVTYVARENRGVIQERVGWQNDVDEIDAVYGVKVAARFPDGHEKAGKSEVLECSMANDASTKALLVNVHLGQFRSIDRLIIEVESTYRVKKSRFYYWEMGLSTRNISITINHPPGHAVIFKAFEHNPELSRQEALATAFHYESESWMLEGSGVAWRLDSQTTPTTTLRERVKANPLIKGDCPDATLDRKADSAVR